VFQVMRNGRFAGAYLLKRVMIAWRCDTAMKGPRVLLRVSHQRSLWRLFAGARPQLACSVLQSAVLLRSCAVREDAGPSHL